MPHQQTFNNIVETTFNTPLVKLNRIVPAGGATVLLKLEFFNPLSSVKDRIGRAMIEAAEKRGHPERGHADHRAHQRQHGHRPGLCCRGQGLPPDADHARVDEPRTPCAAGDAGANLVLTPAKDGMKGAIAKANELAAATPNSWIPQQFDNPANPEVHERTTGPEIWQDTDGQVDMVVAGVGTGGTITGVDALPPLEETPTSAQSPSSRPTRRSSPAASPVRTKCKALAPASSPRTSTPAC